MSASEWPSSPCECGISTPPSTSGPPRTRRCASKAVPTRSSAKRHLASLATAERRDRAVAAGVCRAHCAVVVAPEVVRYVAVGAECDRHAAAVERAQEVGRGVQLARRLAQSRGRDLDRDPGGGDRVGRLLVLA